MTKASRAKRVQRRKAQAKAVRRIASEGRHKPVEPQRRKEARQATDVAIAGLERQRDEASKTGAVPGDATGLDVVEEERRLLEWRGLAERGTRATLRGAGLQGRAEALVCYALALEGHMKRVHNAEGSIDSPDDLTDADRLHDELHGRREEAPGIP